jgi:phosphoribosyl-AMP cyclohydrolase / phosphoribosyl-ATP pyrophosphohydrolase
MIDPDGLAWDKMEGLLPAAVQDAGSGHLLMLGYMNREALAATVESGFVTFWSRSKQRMWRKGESSGNVLRLVSVNADCDRDALLVLADPQGPICHLGTISCFATEAPGAGWLASLERIVADRAAADPTESYTARLLAEGPAKAAQKVGEEGVEVALAAVGRDVDGLAEEAADLLFHLLVALKSRDVRLDTVIDKLRGRHLPGRTGQEHTP